MFDFFRSLFGTDFMPHLYCLRSDPAVLWLQVASDLGIAAAYFAIPLFLFDLLLKRRDMIFRRVALLFVLFISACGATHLLSVWTIWVPVYRLEALVKAITAVVSIATAAVLVKVRPTIFELPSIAQLEEEIQGRRQAEAEAREKEFRLRAFVDSVEDYAIYMLDPNGLILSWNHGAERLKGYAAEEIIGRSFEIFFMQEDREAGLPQQILRLGREEGGFEGEGWRVRKDGSRFLANVHLRPLYEKGELRGFSKVTRDLTKSRDAEEKYRRLLEAAPDAIIIVNGSHEITFVNSQAEKLFQYDRSEVLGKPVDMLVPPPARSAQALYRERLMDQPQHPLENAPKDFRGLRKDQTEFPLEFSVSPLDTHEGRVLLFAVRDLTEKQLTEARFQALLEAAPDALFITDRSGRIAYANRRAEEVFGFARAEILGKPVDVLVPERLRTERAKEREQFFAAPERIRLGYEGEYLCLRWDGSEFPVEASRSPLQTADGMVILTSVRDISERKKSEARFRALLDSAPDAMVISRADGTIELTNRQAERLFGYSREEMIGQKVGILIPEELRSAYGSDEEAFLGGDYDRSMGAGLELRARRKDGSEFPVEIRFSPLDGPNGISMTAAIRDISERLKLETRFRALLESAPDAMVIVNADGNVVLANLQTERLFGYSRMELVGRSVEILVPPEIVKIHAEHRRRFFVDPQQRSMGSGIDLMARRKDGSQFPVEISLSPLEGSSGISVTAAIRDISERKLAAQQLAEKMAELRQSNEALEQFAHIASHDLQEPLRMVASYTQLLSKRYKGRLDAEADEFIGFAVDGTQRMKRLIEDLLLYSRAGRGSPAAMEFSSEEALQDALTNLSAAIAESGAKITWDPLPVIAVAQLQLVQVFQNLIGNAIKYRSEQIPKIHISARESGKEWVFSVADNGIGIEPKYFERVFVIFQRLHGRAEYEGTGIGLAICKRILQQQGGRIWVESEPGIGSTFYFALPVR